MNLITWYRVAILLELYLVGVALASPDWLEPTMPPEVRAYIESMPEPGAAFLLAALIALTSYVIGCVGGLVFWRPSRYLFAASVLAIVLLNPALGSSVDLGWKDLLEEGGTLLDGFLVALMFCSPLRSRFEAPAG